MENNMTHPVNASNPKSEDSVQPRPSLSKKELEREQRARERALAQEKSQRFIRRDRIFLNNPVIMQGLGLAPLIIVASTGKNALILSMTVLLLLTPTRVIAAALSHVTFARFRGAVYALTSAVVYMGVLWILYHIFSTPDIALIGIYLPLLTLDPMVIKRYEHPQPEEISKAIKKGFITTLGFILVIMICGILREFLGAGALFGAPILDKAWLPLASLPTGGFILLGLLMAIWRAAVASVKHQLHMEVSS